MDWHRRAAAAKTEVVLIQEASLFIDALEWKQNGWINARVWVQCRGKLQSCTDGRGKRGPMIFERGHNWFRDRAVRVRCCLLLLA
jgi:hypothetical protein